jgi:hypothetical protein
VGTNGEHEEHLSINATISRATSYKLSSPVDPYLAPTYFEASAMLDGLVNSNIPSQVPGFCPGSRCTFEPYTTLAFCATTKDISSTLLTTVCNNVECNVTTEELKDLSSSIQAPPRALRSLHIRQYLRLAPKSSPTTLSQSMANLSTSQWRKCLSSMPGLQKPPSMYPMLPF